MTLLLSVCFVLVALAKSETLREDPIKQGQGQQVPQIPTVTIAQGDVIGSVAEDGNYYEFHGIPYADSTSGTKRFKAPSPPPNFTEPFEANRKNIKCIRTVGQGYEGTEDCLVANIFTPTLKTAKSLSVMVWIKGKEFDRLNGQDLSFRNFVQKDVVVVSLNYRESILGFLCLGTEAAPGNAGLKDIIAGLKWVKQNIAQFGGNPEEITLFGHGSGAAAVDLVTMSPMSKGLVQRAIAQSGNALAPWAVTRDNLKYALLVAEGLGHEIESVQQLSDIFIKTSVSALMGVINDLDLTDNSLAFSPCVERKELEGVEPFLTKTPSEIISQGEFADIPMIFGFVDNEGTIRANKALNDDWLHRMQKKITDFIPPDLQFTSNDDKMAVVQQIRQYYFQQDEINENHLQEYLKYHGETMMMVSAVREVRKRMFSSYKFNLHSQFYLYQFSYSGTLGKSFEPIEGLDSAAHSEELAYMFYNTPVMETPDLDQTMGNILVERWTNFAKYGIPRSETSQVNWFPCTNLIYNYIRQLTSTEMDVVKNYEAPLQNPHPGTITLWDNIYTTHFRDAQSNWSLDDFDGDVDTSSSTTAPDISSIITAVPDLPSTTPTPDPDISSTTPTQDPDISSTTPTQDPDISSTTPTPDPDISSTTPTPDPDISSTTPTQGPDISSTTPTQDPDISSTTPTPDPDISSTTPTPDPDISSTTPTQDPDISSTTPTPDPDISSTTPTQDPDISSTTPTPDPDISSTTLTPDPDISSTTPTPDPDISSTTPTQDPDISSTTPTPDPDISSTTLTPDPDISSTTLTPDPDISSTTPTQDPDISSTTPTQDPDISSTTPTPDPDISSTTPTPDPDISSTTPTQDPDISSTTPTPDPDISSTTPTQDPDISSTTPTQDPDISSTTPTPAPTPDSNSASTAIAYTFLIVSLFSLLSHLHSSLILS